MDKNKIDFNYIKFKAINEPWNKYKLEDGTILKIKVVLINFITNPKEDDGKSILFKASTVLGVETTKDLRGEPTTLKPGEKPKIIKKDLKYQTIEEDWNEYLLEKDKHMKMKLVITEIDRGEGFDTFGEPIYHVSNTIVPK
jgi:hypothetical protein